jgi:hypothetical protein
MRKFRLHKNIIMTTTSRRMRPTGHVAYMVEVRLSSNIIVGNLGGERRVWGSRKIQEDIIGTDLIEI